MRNSSQKAHVPPAAGDSAATATATRAPRRARGELRVEALLAAAAEVFAQKGFDAATMTEIAAQSGSSIGSLYQFFRTKEALADAVLRAQVEALWTRFDDLAARAPALPTPVLAQALAGLLVGFRGAHPSFARLLEAPVTTLELVDGVRRHMRERIVALLAAHRPAADRALLGAMAPVVQQAMKAGVQLMAEFSGRELQRALGELEAMLAGYLVERLGGA
jgi:AcrR family transcriptional regulator